MSNSAPRITGYRQLSQQEENLINAVKAEGFILESLLSSVSLHLKGQATQALQELRKDAGAMVSTEELDRIKEAEPHRWVAIAKTHFQEGMHALVRAVAQPSTF